MDKISIEDTHHVPFDSATINRVVGLADEDSTKYRELFHQLDYGRKLRKLTIEQTNWNTRRGGQLFYILRGSLTE